MRPNRMESVGISNFKTDSFLTQQTSGTVFYECKAFGIKGL
jgi:hypothetical protein